MRLRLAVVALAVLAAGCSTAARQETKSPAAVDVTGTWRGNWIGYGILEIPREEVASAELTQRGSSGTGRMMLEGTDAAETVPLAMRHAGITGSRVAIDVSGSNVVMTHELGGEFFTLDFVVDGDRMVGQVRGSDHPTRIELTRIKPRVAALVETPPAPAPPLESPPTASEPPASEVAALPADSVVKEPVQVAAESVPQPVVARPEPKEFAPAPGLRAIHFEFDRADIRAAESRVLDANAEWLKSHDEAVVLIEGHCDERGTNEYNLALGERRARAVRDYLVSRGVPSDRVSVVTYGEERPLCRDKSDGCWYENRRAHFLIKPR
jgi:peptidoglycan-associated lipoprotein